MTAKIEMKVSIHDVAVDTEGLGRFNPKLVLGLKSIDGGKTLQVLALEEIVPLKDKVAIASASFSRSVSGSGETVIRSVQLLKGKTTVLAEVAGHVSRQTHLLIKEIIKAMKQFNVRSAFFPAFTSTSATRFLYGDVEMEGVEAVFGDNIQYARVCEDGESLVLAVGRNLLKIHVSHITENSWYTSLYCKTIYSGSKTVLYMGRFQNKKVPVTFVDGVYSFNVATGKIGKINMPSQISRVSAFVGVVKEGISALIEGNNVVVAHSSAFQSAA